MPTILQASNSLNISSATHSQTQKPCMNRDQTGGSQTSTICLSNVFVLQTLLKNLTQSFSGWPPRATAGPRLLHALSLSHTQEHPRNTTHALGMHENAIQLWKAVSLGVLKTLKLVNFPPYFHVKLVHSKP